MAESSIGLFKHELIRRLSHWRVFVLAMAYTKAASPPVIADTRLTATTQAKSSPDGRRRIPHRTRTHPIAAGAEARAAIVSVCLYCALTT